MVIGVEGRLIAMGRWRRKDKWRGREDILTTGHLSLMFISSLDTQRLFLPGVQTIAGDGRKSG